MNLYRAPAKFETDLDHGRTEAGLAVAKPRVASPATGLWMFPFSFVDEIDLEGLFCGKSDNVALS
jgi:hypothetical protein